MKHKPAPDVRAELWQSFVGLLKAYAAAASMGGHEHGVLVLTETSLQIIAAPETLSVAYYQALGRGVWALTSGTDMNRGTFEVNLDGTISLEEIAIDMDHAAIQLIASLTSAAKQNQIEVLV